MEQFAFINEYSRAEVISTSKNDTLLSYCSLNSWESESSSNPAREIVIVVVALQVRIALIYKPKRTM